jgi:hypothetical protein
MSIQGVYRNGHVFLNSPPNWPEGQEVSVLPTIHDPLEEIVGMSEEEQSDDPTAIAKWVKDVQATPSLSWSEEEIARLEAWQADWKAFQKEAVRKQFQDGIK